MIGATLRPHRCDQYLCARVSRPFAPQASGDSNLDLGQIEAFVQVAQHRSFSKAADALFLTQPSVTARIQSLERDLGETLFERNGRGVRLTETGTTFLPFARRSLKALQDGRDALDGMRN